MFVEKPEGLLCRQKYAKELIHGKRILVLGCGDGRLVKDLKGGGYEVVGLEINRERVAAAKEAGLPVHECDVENDLTPIGGMKFDTIFAVDFFNHLVKLHDTLDKIKEHMADGCRMVVTSQNVMWIPWRILYLLGRIPPSILSPSRSDYHYHVYYTDKLFRKLMDETGYAVARIIFYAKIPYTNIYFKVPWSPLACGFAAQVRKQ